MGVLTPRQLNAGREHVRGPSVRAPDSIVTRIGSVSRSTRCNSTVSADEPGVGTLLAAPCRGSPALTGPSLRLSHRGSMSRCSHTHAMARQPTGAGFTTAQSDAKVHRAQGRSCGGCVDAQTTEVPGELTTLFPLSPPSPVTSKEERTDHESQYPRLNATVDAQCPRRRPLS